MAFNSIRKRFTKQSTENIVGLLDLEYTTSSIMELGDDLSEVKITDSKVSTPLLRVQTENIPQVPIIGIGGAGTRIADQIALRLMRYNISYPVMGIDIDEIGLDKMENITEKLIIPADINGTGKQFLKGQIMANEASVLIKDKINSYLNNSVFTYKHEIVFLVLGAGGFGVGASLEIASILLDMGKRPVPILILPSEEENTRIQFNAAVALYRFNYAPSDRVLNLSTICIDNSHFLDKNAKKSISEAISAINERIGATIGDILLSTVVEGHGYSSDMNEFLEIFRNIKSVGFISYLFTDKKEDQINELFNSYQRRLHSLDVNITSGTRSYLFIESKSKTISSLEYRELIKLFNNMDVFPKLHENDSEEDFFNLRGITTGLQLNERLKKLITKAEDVKVTILNQEIDTSQEGAGNPKIDRLKGDLELKIQTGDELAKESSHQSSKERREGDLS